jgi:hypothetical protein
LARSSYGSEGGGSYQDSAVVNSLLRKLRPNDRTLDRSFSPDRPSGAAKPLSSIRSVRPVKPGAVWGCVALGALLAAAVPAWPYENDCGQWLFLYLGSVSLVVIAGLWGARVSWRGRIGWAHVLAVMTIIWGLALTAHQVLPREPTTATRRRRRRSRSRCGWSSPKAPAFRGSRGVYSRVLGSRASRTASPTKFNPTTVTNRAAPGPNTIHGACCR